LRSIKAERGSMSTTAFFVALVISPLSRFAMGDEGAVRLAGRGEQGGQGSR
jgi:hypothetical protein